MTRKEFFRSVAGAFALSKASPESVQRIPRPSCSEGSILTAGILTLNEIRAIESQEFFREHRDRVWVRCPRTRNEWRESPEDPRFTFKVIVPTSPDMRAAFENRRQGSSILTESR
jgi:hypothetical protein